MKKISKIKIPPLIYLIFGLIFGIIFTKYLGVKLFEFSIENLIVFGIISSGIVIIGSTIQNVYKSTVDNKQALGLPSGSVRAILALSLIVLFVFMSALFYLTSNYDRELAEKILTILGTLVIAISSFYFGAKSTEQGSNIAQAVFQRAKDNANNRIPSDIILKAIAQNKEKWIKEFSCTDIKIGKKESGGTTFDTDCIVFFVETKNSTSVDKANRIPITIPVIVDEKNYNIPTDVRTIKQEPLITSKPTLDLIEAFIVENRDTFLSKFKADSIQAALKVVAGKTVKTPCIQFIVKDKFSLPSGAEKIPEFFIYNGFKIITDVKEEDEPTEDATEISPGDSIHRQGSMANGTLGLRVFKEFNGQKTYYFLSCYHVFCNPELKSGKTVFSPTVSAPIIANSNSSILGDVIEGELNSKMDASLCLINSDISANPALKGYAFTPKNGIRVITDDDVLLQTNVFTYGAVTKAVAGRLIARKVDRNVTIFGNRYLFKDVIPVTKISVPGDSGALVADENGRVIGIIFASNPTTSYIIPISEIIIHFNIKISYAN